VERIGLPEAEINLSHCAVVLAKSPKSRESYDAWGEAKAAATQYPDLPVPLGLRNAPTKLMKDLGYGKGAKWEAGYIHPDGFLPPELSDTDFFK
jgi:putative ATPase